MKESYEIGKISFDINEKELQAMASAGRLGIFVERATELFRRNLKSELVSNVSSGSTTLVRFEDDEYGSGGPIGPLPHIFAELEMITNKVKEISGLIEINRI